MSWKSGEAMRIKLGGDRKFTGRVRYYHRHAEGRDSSKAALQWREHQVKMVRVRRRRMAGLVLGFLLIVSLVSTTYYLLFR
jgi:hypothetical protein